MRSILATDFGIWPALTDIHKISDRMLASTNYWSRLANYILLYDQIIIPTSNLQVLPVLRNILGEDIFDELVKNKIIVLARYDQWISYGGNGQGLSFFKTEAGSTNENKHSLFHSHFKPLDETIETALTIMTPSSSQERKKILTNLLLDNIVPVASTIDTKAFREETYKDILGSPYLRHFLSLRNRGRSLDKLKGINSNQIRIYSPHTPLEKGQSPEIQSVLHAAFENFILGIGSDLGVQEITGDGSTLALLKAKGERIGASIQGEKAFMQIQEISNIPDIGYAFASKAFTPEQLLDLRESKHAQVFRDWFGSGTGNEPAEEIVQKYVESIGKPSIIENLPLKVLRFATTSTAGLIDPVTGVITSAVDSLLLSKWFPGKSPRLFLKQVKSMQLKKASKKKPSLIPTLSGRDRNRPCSCGSGLKYKNCCGR